MLSKYTSDKSGVYYSAYLTALVDGTGKITLETRYNELDVKDIANKINFSEMTFSRAKQRLSINALTEKDSKVFTGIALFADIRNFTSKFKDDDSNLKEMSDKAINAITTMINKVIDADGAHIQVQGDKEVAVFPLNYELEDGDNLKEAVICALKIRDALARINLDVGIGMSFGDIYVAMIDIRGSKDPVILGETVTLGSRLEDDEANPNEVVISKQLYEILNKFKESKFLCRYFRARKNYYVTSMKYSDLVNEERKKTLDENTNAKSYYGVHSY